MKKWIITLSVLLGVSAIGGGVVLGKLYKQELKTYESQENKLLNKEALKNIYIESDVPVKLEVTEGEPRVEFESHLTGIIDEEPQYELNVRTEGDKSYITVDAKQMPHITLFLKDVDEVATIYLPKQDINKLSVKSNNHYWINAGRDLYYNIEDVNINELKIESDVAAINLEGSYKTIDMDSGYGDVTINSQTPAEVYLRGKLGDIRLKGEYTVIDIEGDGGLVNIDSVIPAEVTINTYDSKVNLAGKYKSIEIEADGGVDIKSQSKCDVLISGSGDIQLEGPINNVDIKSRYSTVSLVSTIQPQRINLWGEYEDVFLTLPRNISGFEAIYQNDYEEQDLICTDFDVIRGGQEGNVEKIYYGDKTSKIKLGRSNGMISILEGKEVSNQ